MLHYYTYAINPKKSIFLILFLVCLLNLKSQNGLENIIVEKYYVSSANDTADRRISGFLPIGSTTYRIFLDMMPGYRFYSAYGKKGHELRIQTTTLFFNNEDLGNSIANVIPRRNLKEGTLMLDSWLSAGMAGENSYGVLKEQDDNVETIVHDKSFLQNANPLAGIPVKDRDGILFSAIEPFPVLFGIDSLITSVFFRQTKGGLFSTTNGAWGCLGGSVGLDSLTTNRVLIAQLTTDGDLSFELNIQIGKPDGTLEFYVAKNPIPQLETSLPCLTYNSRTTKLNVAKEKKPKNKK
jgi:hypothetical protein